MTAQEHIERELGGTWEEKQVNARKDLLKILQKIFVNMILESL